MDPAGKKQLVLSGSKCVASYNPDTGKQHWTVDKVPTEQYVASLVYTDGLLFLTCGFPTFHNMAIRPDGSGNVTKTHVVWRKKKVPAQGVLCAVAGRVGAVLLHDLGQGIFPLL